MKKEDLIRNLKVELSKLEETKKTYDTFETRYDLMIKDVLNYVENSTPNEKIESKIEELKNEKYILSSRDAEIILLQGLLEGNK